MGSQSSPRWFPIFLWCLLLSPLCISDFTDLGFFSPHFCQVCQGSVNLAYFLKEPAFCFIDSLYFFVVSISLILSLIFIIPLLLLDWDLLVFVFLGV
jgi:hypothetical protein